MPPPLRVGTPAGKGLGDVRTVSSEFLLSLQHLWRRREIVADKYPELIFTSMVKLARVLKVEVGGPGDFAKLGKDGVIGRRLVDS